MSFFGKIKGRFYPVALTNAAKYTILITFLRSLYGRGNGEKPFMRKVRAFQKQGAGEIPVEATLRKVQQKITALALALVRMKRRGKSSPPVR